MEGANLYDDKLKGLIPRMFEYLFAKIGAADSKVEFTIKCSYLEIYMERICDLLDGKSDFNLCMQPRSRTCR
jgi:kinesin family member 5